MRYHILYKTTNNVNNKIYIGVHSTDNLDDGYLGSGVALLRAIKKHGSDCFSRVILGFYYTFQAALADEAKIVNEDFVKDRNNYNMTDGGMGGLHFIGRVITEDELARRSESRKANNPIYQPEMISWMQDLIDDGVSAKRISELLNEKNIKNTHGRSWTQGRVQRYVAQLKEDNLLRDRIIQNKSCAICGTKFGKGELKVGRFKNKKCCSRTCSAKFKWRTSRANERLKEKKCSVCGLIFSPKNTNKIETCSRSCGGVLASQRKVEDKECLHCLSEFKPKNFKAKYCSPDCYQKSRKAS